jgi:hypothetical protein
VDLGVNRLFGVDLILNYLRNIAICLQPDCALGDAENLIHKLLRTISFYTKEVFATLAGQNLSKMQTGSSFLTDRKFSLRIALYENAFFSIT